MTFDTLLKEQDPFGSTACRFDLTGVELITPCELVQLAAACYALSSEGRRPIIVVNEDSVRTCLM